MNRAGNRPLFFLLLSILLGLFQGGELSLAAELPGEPLLRIETGMHTTRIEKIGVDAENRYLVTGSADNTVRVWELPAGRLLKTLRPPIRNANEIVIYAVAISPDGKTVACGGMSGDERARSFMIYFFDRESGRLIKNLSGVPNRIIHLAYSKDGRFLAASLGGKAGLRVFQTSDFAPVAEDKDYGNTNQGVDFDQNGRLASVSQDGYLRLYDPGFRSPAKEKLKSGQRPSSVSFSPDGSKIAVGYYDSSKVDVYSGKIWPTYTPPVLREWIRVPSIV